MKWAALGLFVLGVAMLVVGYRLDARGSFNSGAFIGELLFLVIGVGAICASVVLLVIIVLIGP